ncbi:MULTISPECIES: TRADD-N-associated membrane domain-containing protein [Nostoc]|uniref:Cyanobacterial TRADD-N associated 2 transmembrane domain-containing protein n=1 Tax=Nostoc paludosum FACHB-159 TaxID=2692908 RepID=A0ABR8KK13_9NOSO|nr:MULTISPECIES: hypothetical protein [Nostoc]MBD2683078.1 hypothetical protein [Nostoc sp. FACHB-857]MBD2739420.1 hypothetical protein [Nostoc paludosum FACHB-159]
MNLISRFVSYLQFHDSADTDSQLSLGCTQKTKQSVNTCLFQEHLRQARLSFNFTFGVTMASTVIGLGSVVLLLLGEVQKETVIAAGEITVSIAAVSHELTKHTNDKLEKISQTFKDED